MREIFQSWMHAVRHRWSEGRMACFHCGDAVRQSRAVEVKFDGEVRRVCCHGCAAVLKTVEQMEMQQQYYEQKMQAVSQDEK